ncbi:MAG: hypothetical protein KAY24_01690 [Candidatus Eisenbacteria sp.]|nr:hypothetical protein [Candidatus Eisenbacteria bacterium]
MRAGFFLAERAFATRLVRLRSAVLDLCLRLTVFFLALAEGARLETFLAGAAGRGLRLETFLAGAAGRGLRLETFLAGAEGRGLRLVVFFLALPLAGVLRGRAREEELVEEANAGRSGACNRALAAAPEVDLVGGCLFIDWRGCFIRANSSWILRLPACQDIRDRTWVPRDIGSPKGSFLPRVHGVRRSSVLPTTLVRQPEDRR